MLINIKEMIYYLGLHTGSVVSVVGSGGKTTLIETLAEELSKRCRVCVAASTKMKYPENEQTHVILRGNLSETGALTEPGIYYVADEKAGGGKLHGFSGDTVQWALNNTDIVLIEADGSHTLPLKGWADYEPVVIPQTQITIGVMPVYPLGKKAGPENIHRFSLFSEMTGAVAGDIITKEHLIRAISSPQGLFGKAVGEKVLFFSQVTGEAMEDEANDIAADARLDFIDKIMIGSVRS